MASVTAWSIAAAVSGLLIMLVMSCRLTWSRTMAGYCERMLLSNHCVPLVLSRRGLLVMRNWMAVSKSSRMLSEDQ